MASVQEAQLKNIISSNRAIQDLVRRNTEDFLQIRAEIDNEPETQRLKIFQESQPEMIENLRAEQLTFRARSNRTPLALCGENSSGKTTYAHRLLGIGNILDSGDGPITARITKLTFATGDQARIRIYRTIRDQTLNEPEISLAPFFAGNKPDWKGIGEKLSKHIKRPEGMDEMSEEFARWARCFVEIHLPSPILAQGIDVYDTPGFLVGEAPVFTEILHDLVEFVHPTIVFMYGNPSTDDATQACFVAVKAALHDLDSESIFFLNSKVDVDRMNGWTENMTEEEFSVVLARERAQRFELLRRAPFLADASLESLPASIDQCRSFDICGALSQTIKIYGPMMNDNAIQRIIQWTVDGHLTRAKRGSQLILPMIDSFFDFLTRNHPRTPKELTALKTDAMNWAGRYFQAFNSYTDPILTDLSASVSQRFETLQSPIVNLFLDKRCFRITKEELLGAMNLAIIRPAIHHAVEEHRMNLLESMRSTEDLLPSIVHKRLFANALYAQDINQCTATLLEAHGAENSIDTGLLYMINTISNSIGGCAAILANRLWAGQFSTAAMSALTHHEGSSASRSNREAIIGQFMLRCQENLGDYEIQLRREVQLSGRKQERMLRSLIEEYYNSISPLLSCHPDTLQRLRQYFGRLMKIACELKAAHDMATFLGQPPQLHDDARPSSMFTTFTADWGNENNLTVKKITQPSPDPTHDEAHHHRRVALLQHPHIFNLRYLYHHALDHQTSEVWMIFPPIFSTVDQFLRENLAFLSIEQLFHWMADIADALKTLHAHGLVHRNVIWENLLLTEDRKVLLVDLGDVHNPASTADGIRRNIKGLGKIGTVLKAFLPPQHKTSSILGAFDDLMGKCYFAAEEQSITAEFANQNLRSMLKRL